LAAALLAGTAGVAWYGHNWWTVGRFVESTDDAYVGGNITSIAPHVSGFIAEVLVTDATPPVTDPFSDRIKAREAEFRGYWALADLRNDRVRAATGVKFRPLDDSIRDCVESLVSIAGVEVKRRQVAEQPVAAE
jgi:hypothetical protein